MYRNKQDRNPIETNQERLRQSRQVNNKQSDTKCSARNIEMESSIHRADRATGNVE